MGDDLSTFYMIVTDMIAEVIAMRRDSAFGTDSFTDKPVSPNRFLSSFLI